LFEEQFYHQHYCVSNSLAQNNFTEKLKHFTHDVLNSLQGRSKTWKRRCLHFSGKRNELSLWFGTRYSF
jgi:hypothetical protein